MKKYFLFLFSLCSLAAFSQTNILSTNTTAEQIMLGNYSPNNYKATNVIIHPDSIVNGVYNNLNQDSVRSYLERIVSFQNRNTGSDTLSSVKGIGAARRWAFKKFQEFSAASENRLVTSYLQFDRLICNINQHRNIFTVLPGMDSTDNSIIIIEAHLDSRCQGSCDTNCLAEGAEDNASGSALVLELARVMSKYSYDHTIVFMLTIGEEQGLYGADAFSDYVQQKGINVKAVFNNDVIGGIICGQTSSAPSCPGLNHIDSTQVRLFSSGSFNSPHKSLCRFIKLEYQEELLPLVQVPMLLTLMSAEDRAGRGGDHIPFRQKGYKAMRFCSANEHGDASNGPGYTDRQHTDDDILGVDTNNDNIIDSLFVNINYLLRNAAINATASAMAAIGPETPTFSGVKYGNGIIVTINDPLNYMNYRVGIRTTMIDFDTVYTFTNTQVDTIYPPNGGTVFITVASVDSNGVESLFSNETNFAAVGEVELVNEEKNPVELLQNRPNPFDEATYISVKVDEHNYKYNSAFIEIRDIQGKLVEKIDIPLNYGINEVLYTHGYNQIGSYLYSLVIDEKPVSSKWMVFAN